MRAEAPLAASASARDTLLDVLQERVRDVHANTRAAVLKVWISLCSEDALPIERTHAIAAIAVDRLRDKTSTVRSAAMQLVAALLENSPFGTSLNPSMFANMLEAEQQLLTEHQASRALPAVAEADEEDDDDVRTLVLPLGA